MQSNKTAIVNRNLLARTAARLFARPEERERFELAFTDCNPDQMLSAAIWVHELPDCGTVAWTSSCARILSSDERRRLQGRHDAGEVYFFDPSSLFCISALHEVESLETPIVLDLCSAPGGKGIYAWRYFTGPQIIANEVSQGRIPALISNLKRCRVAPVGVTTREAKFFAQRTPHCFGLTIVDAPCSGQSLLLKEIKNPGCFHPMTIRKNSLRQKQILSNAAETVMPGGYLLYSTCTFSSEENEEVIEWFLKRFAHFAVVPVQHLEQYRTQITGEACYRLYPWQGGAGGFTALLRNNGVGEAQGLPDLQFCWSS